jgi:hypothetical protein
MLRIALWGAGNVIYLLSLCAIGFEIGWENMVKKIIKKRK